MLYNLSILIAIVSRVAFRDPPRVANCNLENFEKFEFQTSSCGAGACARKSILAARYSGAPRNDVVN